MKKLFPIVSIIIFTILFTNCKKKTVTINNAAEFESYLNKQMDKQKIPALSVLIFEGSTVLYENYLGKSHIKNKVDLKSDHVILLASVSKVITATALLQLYDQGLFGLDDKINDYLPFNVTTQYSATDITFKMLLTHTSGIADGSALDNQYYYGEDSPVALKYFLENYLVAGGEFYNEKENFYDAEAGSDFQYSNVGNALIGLLVQEISGLDFNDYCKQNIFTPLGMNNSHWRLDETTETIVTPYERKFGKYKEIEHYTFTDYPNGGLRSNCRDLHTFLSTFALGGTQNGYQLLQTSTINEMITPQIPSLDNTMGLHLFLMNKDNNLWGHDGGEKGISTIMAYNPTTKIGAIILTNQSDINLDDILVESYKFGLKL